MMPLPRATPSDVAGHSEIKFAMSVGGRVRLLC
jgi:hypothetical protein